MTAREQAVEAAARTMAAQNMAGGASPWDAEDDEPGFAHAYGWASPSEFRIGHREMAAEVLAADRIKRRIDLHPYSAPLAADLASASNEALLLAAALVRAAAEGWPR